MKKIFASVAVALACVVSFNAFAGGNADRGKTLVATCAACHGQDFNSPADPAYPKLAGQNQDYIEHALIAYQRGDAPNGRNNAIMGPQAKPLSHQDIRDIAAYIHSLKGSLVVRK